MKNFLFSRAKSEKENSLPLFYFPQRDFLFSIFFILGSIRGIKIKIFFGSEILLAD